MSFRSMSDAKPALPAKHSTSDTVSTSSTTAGSDVPLRDLADSQIGDFRLLRRLGRGGMAEVYLAEQVSLRRHVALKVLRSELAADASYIERFQVEAEAAARISHPNIVQVFAVGADRNVHYIAQEYVPGQNLREFLARQGPPDGATALAIMRQVARALAEAADRGIVHRDIKPENILLGPKGEIKVADFGLARSTGAASSLTQVGITMGTPLYMSPEQIEGRSLDHRSDQYSFGVTCYHMLTGRPPFSGETALSIAVQHLKSDPPALERLRPDLPKPLCRLIAKTMAKDPARRYPSAKEVVDELDRLASRGGSAGMRSAGGRDGDVVSDPEAFPGPWADRFREIVSPWARYGRSSTRSRIAAVYLASVLVAALAGMATAWLSREPDILAESPTARALGVEQAENAAQQVLLARLAQGSNRAEAAWKAVIEYWPEDKQNQMEAKQELALLYLKQARDDEAGAIFDELARQNDPGMVEFRAFGLAGLIALHADPDSAEEQTDLFDLVEQLYPLAAELGRSSANRRIRQLQVLAM
jgi:serine/threonine-protein kinase